MSTKPAYLHIRIGCCGFPISRKVYYQHFSIVELQNIFYQLPRLSTAQKWRDQAPSEFLFCMKAWQVITHPASSPTYRRLKKSPITIDEQVGMFQPTTSVFRAWELTREIALAINAFAVVFQCPPHFGQTHQHIQNLKRFFGSIQPQPFQLVLEFRSAWDTATVAQLCEELRLIHGVDPFKEKPAAGDIYYFRLHGSPPGPHMYKYQYSTNDLLWLKHQITSSWSDKPICCFFNNTTMWEDAQRFQEMIQKEDKKTPGVNEPNAP